MTAYKKYEPVIFYMAITLYKILRNLFLFIYSVNPASISTAFFLNYR